MMKPVATRLARRASRRRVAPSRRLGPRTGAGGGAMRRHHASVVTAVTAFLAALALAGPAGAHNHPTQVELDAPAVVFVKTFAQVNVSLIEHNRHGKHIGLLQETYEPELASGSGFAVDPNGTVVTAGDVVTPDLDKAKIFAVNKIFGERYGRNAPLPR